MSYGGEHDDKRNTNASPRPNTSKRVLLLCGLPGAGKSSLSSLCLAQDASQSVEVIEYDNVQESLLESNTAGEDNNNLLQAWRQSRQKALESLRDSLWNSRISTIVLDDNFFLRSMRKQVHQVCQEAVTDKQFSVDICFGLAWVDTPLMLCLERNRDRHTARRVPEEVITRMSGKFEVPDAKKAWWEKAVIRLDGSAMVQENLERLLHFARELSVPVESLLDPEIESQRIEMERSRTRESALHRADMFLRSCVQSVAQMKPQSAGHANALRKRLLATLKKADDSSDARAEDLMKVKEMFTTDVLEGNLWTEAERESLETHLDNALENCN